MYRFDKLNSQIYTAAPMARLEVEVEKVKCPEGVLSYTFTSTGLDAHADFNPVTGVVEVKFEEATNMTAALGAIVDTLNSEARRLKIPTLKIDIIAGRFIKKLRQVAPNFDLKEESGDQVTRFHGEFSVPQNPQVLS